LTEHDVVRCGFAVHGDHPAHESRQPPGLCVGGHKRGFVSDGAVTVDDLGEPVVHVRAIDVAGTSGDEEFTVGVETLVIVEGVPVGGVNVEILAELRRRITTKGGIARSFAGDSKSLHVKGNGLAISIDHVFVHAVGLGKGDGSEAGEFPAAEALIGESAEHSAGNTSAERGGLGSGGQEVPVGCEGHVINQYLVGSVIVE